MYRLLLNRKQRWSWLLSIWILFFTQFHEGYAKHYGSRVIRTINPSNGSSVLYFLSYENRLTGRHQLRLIPDNVTLVNLGFSESADPMEANAEMAFVEYHSLMSHSQLLEPLPPIHYKDFGPDELIRVVLARSRSLQPIPLIYNLTYFGSYLNPSVLWWQDGQFVTESLSVSLRGIKTDERVRFMWLNNTFAPMMAPRESLQVEGQRQSYLGVPVEVIESLGDHELFCQDPRLLQLDNEQLLLVCTKRSNSLRMEMLTLFLNHSRCPSVDTKCPQSFVDIKNHINVIHPDMFFDRPQKNWSPFLLDHKLYLVQFINPFHVVRIVNYTSPLSFTTAHTVSLSHLYNLDFWEKRYGAVRGGTPALPIGNGVYLAFFHSSCTLPHNFMKTYFFGAYTFTASPLFELRQMSPVPITDENDLLYTGSWNSIHPRHIDYVPFPMSFYFERGTPLPTASPLERSYPDTIVLSFGHQDRAGMLARIPLANLMSSLIDIDDS